MDTIIIQEPKGISVDTWFNLLGVFAGALLAGLISIYVAKRQVKYTASAQIKLDAYRELIEILINYKNELKDLYNFANDYVNQEKPKPVTGVAKFTVGGIFKYEKDYKQIINQNIPDLFIKMAGLEMILVEIKKDIEEIKNSHEIVSESFTKEKISAIRSNQTNNEKKMPNSYEEQQKLIEKMLITIQENISKIIN